MTTCRHCGRPIEQDTDGAWIDPEATGDDVMWRETCDAHDTFMADHEPDDAGTDFPWCLLADDGSVLERFDSSRDAYTALADPSYGASDVAYLADPFEEVMPSDSPWTP